jgi:hypothetical protein
MRSAVPLTGCSWGAGLPRIIVSINRQPAAAVDRIESLGINLRADDHGWGPSVDPTVAPKHTIADSGYTGEDENLATRQLLQQEINYRIEYLPPTILCP